MAVEMNITREEAKRCVGEGWSGLIDAIFDQLPEEAFITCIKEKWGGLRVYVDGVDETVLDFLDEMEEKSYQICEVCGRPGKPREGGWVRTLCNKHAKEFGHDHHDRKSAPRKKKCRL